MACPSFKLKSACISTLMQADFTLNILGKKDLADARQIAGSMLWLHRGTSPSASRHCVERLTLHGVGQLSVIQCYIEEWFKPAAEADQHVSCAINDTETNKTSGRAQVWGSAQATWTCA